MSVLILRNKKDKDIKKITRFLDEELRDVGVDVKVKNLYHLKGKDIPEYIKDYQVIIVFTHGSDTELFYSTPRPSDLMTAPDIFVDLSNAMIFDNKKIISFACSSAKKLGPYCVDKEEDGNCISFVGFTKDISYNLGTKSSSQTTGFFYKLYAKIFSEVVHISLKNNLSPKSITRLYEYKTNEVLMRFDEYGIIPEFDIRLLSEINTILDETKDSIEALGDTISGICV